jgi:topoisomerase IA-like protein
MDGFRVSLQDGTRWAQTDGKAIALEPRVGHKVLVKRGALGSYLMSIAGQPGVKVQRVN